MKQKHRQHLKSNALAESVFSLREFLEARRRTFRLAGSLVALALVAILAWVTIRQTTEARSQELLAAAMVVLQAPVQPPDPAQPPRDGQPGTMATQAPGTYPTEQARLEAAVPAFRAVVDQYPDSAGGIVAQYHLATTLATLGRHDEALGEFDGVIARTDPESLYGRMARMGQASSQTILGQHEPAIATYTALLEQPSSPLPPDAVLKQLATAYQAAGNADEAKKAWSRIVHEHPLSPYSAEAGKQIK